MVALTREAHLAECRWCRIGINCIEWYRRGFTGCWCAACSTDHWVTWEGEPRPLDVVTITWWSSWGLTPPISVLLGNVQIRGRTEHTNAREAVLFPSDEGTLWIRGAYQDGAPELAALLAAKALAS